MAIVYPPEPWLRDARMPLLAAHSTSKLTLQRIHPILPLPKQIVHCAKTCVSFLQVPLEQRQVLAQDGDVRMASRATMLPKTLVSMSGAAVGELCSRLGASNHKRYAFHSSNSSEGG